MVRSTEWTIETNKATYTTDGVSIEGGWMDFTVGRDISLQFIFEEDARQSDYESIREIGEYLYDGAVETGTDYREVPYFKQYVHPNAGHNSYLWNVTPDSSIDGVDAWWMVVTDIQDDSLYGSTGQRITVTGFVIAPSTEGGRTLITDRYEV